MTVKKGNKTIPITLPEYHQKKLKVICERTGISKSGVVQRLIEQHQIFVEADTKPLNQDGQT
jgi:predicted DNA-binding protein